LAYKHGVYAEIIPSGYAPIPDGVETIPVYIGVAPIQQLNLSDNSSKINKAIKLSSISEAEQKIGYSEDWDTFSLCEAVKAHFGNALGTIGPIFVINVLDPATHKKASTATLNFTDNVCYIDKPIILSSLAITDKVLDTDYSIEYDGERVKVTKITTIADGTSATFDEIDITKVDTDDIIAALPEIDNIYRTFGQIVNIIAAPGWSQKPAVAVAIASKCASKISSKYECVGVVDIDSSDADALTVADAVTWKATNSYNSKYLKVCYPKFSYGGVYYWGSTLTVALMQQIDYSNDNTPHISPSNKQIQSDGTVLADGTELIFDETKANELNASGITTLNYCGGVWRLWGPHMANYNYSNLASINAEDRSDASIRMLQYLNNKFIERFIESIDTPFTRRVIEGILVSSQQWLNSLVNEGKLLFGEIEFQESNNPNAEITDGNFVFNVGTTTAPIGKSITFKIQYDAQGLTNLLGGDGV